jgi:hypothetical protein
VAKLFDLEDLPPDTGGATDDGLLDFDQLPKEAGPAPDSDLLDLNQLPKKSLFDLASEAASNPLITRINPLTGKLNSSPAERQILSGAAGLAGDVIGGAIPLATQAVANVAAPVFKPVGLDDDIQRFSAKVTQGFQNLGVVKGLDQAAENLNEKQKQYGDKNLGDLLNEERYADSANYLALSVLENAPQQLAIIGAAVSGVGTVPVLVGVSTAAASGKFRDIEEINEERRAQGIDTIGTGRQVISSIINGGLEGIGETIGTFTVSRVFKDILKDIGEKKGKELFARVFSQILKNSFEEGLEEVGTQLGQDTADNLLKTHPTQDGTIPWVDLVPRAAEAAAIGFTSGGAITSPTVAIKVQIEKQRQALIDQLPDDVKDKLKTIKIEAKKIREAQLKEGEKKLAEGGEKQFEDPQNIESLKQQPEPKTQTKEAKQFKAGKAEVELSKELGLEGGEFARKAKILKEKLIQAEPGVDPLEQILQVPELRVKLFEMTEDELQSAPLTGPGSILEKFKNDIIHFAGDPAEGPIFFGVEERVSEEGESAFVPRIYKPGAQSSIDQFLSVVSGTDKLNRELANRTFSVKSLDKNTAGILASTLQGAVSQRLSQVSQQPQDLLDPASELPSDRIASDVGEQVDREVVGLREGEPGSPTMEQLKAKLSPRGVKTIQDLSKGKRPAEIKVGGDFVPGTDRSYKQVAAEFKAALEEARKFVGAALAQFGGDLKVIKKPKVTIFRGVTGFREGETAGRGGKPIIVGAKVTSGKTLKSAKIEISEKKLRNDYRRFNKGEQVWSNDVEQLSPKTFEEFENPEEGYIEFVILHEMIHFIAGIDGTAMDENLVNLLALEEIRKSVDAPMPNLDAEIQRLNDVFSGKKTGHVSGFPWTIKTSNTYDVTYVKPDAPRSVGKGQRNLVEKIRAAKANKNPTIAEQQTKVIRFGKSLLTHLKMRISRQGEGVREFKTLTKNVEATSLISNVEKVLGEMSGGRMGIPAALQFFKDINENLALGLRVPSLETVPSSPTSQPNESNVIVATSVRGRDVIKLRDSGVRFMEINEHRGVVTPVTQQDIREGNAYADVKTFNDVTQAKAKAGLVETYDPNDVIDLEVQEVFDVAQEDIAQKDAAVELADEIFFLSKSVPEQSAIVSNTIESRIYDAFRTLAEHEKADPDFKYNNKLVKQLMDWVRETVEGKQFLERAKTDPGLDIQDLKTALPKDLQVLFEAWEETREFEERGFSTPTNRKNGETVDKEANFIPKKYATTAPTRYASKTREGWNLGQKILHMAHGFFNFARFNDTNASITNEVLKEKENFFQQFFPEGIADEGLFKNTLDNIFRTLKLKVQGEKDGNATLLAVWGSNEILMMQLVAIRKNFPEKVNVLSDGRLDFDTDFVRDRLQLMWKSLEEFFVPSEFADKDWNRIVKSKKGKGSYVASPAFYKNNPNLNPKDPRPEMYYFNQLTPDEQSTAAYLNSRITQMRDVMIANGYWKDADVIGNILEGYLPGRYRQVSTEIGEQRAGTLGVKHDRTSSERLKKSIDADDFIERTPQQDLIPLSYANIAYADYVRENFTALAHRRLAADLRRIPNPLAPVDLSVIVYKQDVRRWFQDNKWKKVTRGSKEAAKVEKKLNMVITDTTYIRPDNADTTIFPKQTYTLNAFLSGVMKYGEMNNFNALRDPKDGVPWIDKRAEGEFENIFGSDLRGAGLEFLAKANFLAKLTIMYSPGFQLFQVGASIAASIGNPLKIGEVFAKVHKRSPGALWRPFNVGKFKRGPFETVATSGDYATEFDMIQDQMRYGIATSSPMAVFQELFNEVDHGMNDQNPKKGLYQTALNTLTMSSQFLFTTVLGNLASELWVTQTAMFEKRMINAIEKSGRTVTPSLMKAIKHKAKRLSALTSNTVINLPGRHVHGKEKVMLDSLLFARDFTVSMARLATGVLGIQDISGLAKVPFAGSTLLKVAKPFKSFFWGEVTPAEFKMISPVLQGHFARSMGILMVVGNLVNLITTALLSQDREPKLMLENEDGKKFQIFMGDDGEGRVRYLNFPAFQEFTTLLQFLPNAGPSQGIGKGPLEAAFSRASVPFRFAQQVFDNATVQGGDIFVDSVDADLNDWFRSWREIGDLLSPDFTRSSRDRNKAPWEYVTGYLFGSPITRGYAGYEDIIPSGINPIQFERELRAHIQRIDDERKEMLRQDSSKLYASVNKFIHKYPLNFQTGVNVIRRRAAPQEAFFQKLRQGQPQLSKKALQSSYVSKNTFLQRIGLRDAKEE